MTIREAKELSRRLKIAELLFLGHTYEQIKLKLNKVGIATITRVNHWLNQGSGGYELILKRLKQKEVLKNETKWTKYKGVTPFLDNF